MTATTISMPNTAASTRPVGGSIVADTLVIARRNLTRVVRTPQLVFFQTAQPVMFVLLFRYVFGGAIAPAGFEGRYVDFLIPGILVQTSLFSGAGTAFGLAEDISKGIIDRFRSLPMARSAVLAGRVLADMVRTLFTTLLMVGVGMLVGFRFHNGFVNGVFAIALVMLFSFAFSWFFALTGLVVKNIESTFSSIVRRQRLSSMSATGTSSAGQIPAFPTKKSKPPRSATVLRNRLSDPSREPIS